MYNGTSAVTIKVEPAPTYKLAGAPTVAVGSGSASSMSTGDVYGGYTYEIGTLATLSVQSGTTIAIAASNATALDTFNVTLVDTSSSDDPNETPYTEGNLKLFGDAAKTTQLTVANIEINEGHAFTCYLGSDESDTGTSKEIVWDITNDIDYPVKVEMEYDFMR